MKISVIIPTLNAAETLDALLSALEKQTLPPEEILVVDSSSEDRTVAVVGHHLSARLRVIEKESFNHGATRDAALRETRGDVVVFMTQDAIPAGADLLRNLVAPLQRDPKVAAVYARQLPREDASPAECLTRAFNYPESSAVHSLEDLPALGIRTFFLSDVCAAYRRDLYESLGGFEKDLVTNEDMFFAAKAIQSGYKVAYAADARVIHSHNLTLKEQYNRNKVQGYEIARHRTLLSGATASGAGLRLLRFVSAGLLRRGRIFSWFRFLADTAARILGSRAGKRAYLSLPPSQP